MGTLFLVSRSDLIDWRLRYNKVVDECFSEQIFCEIGFSFFPLLFTFFEFGRHGRETLNPTPEKARPRKRPIRIEAALLFLMSATVLV